MGSDLKMAPARFRRVVPPLGVPKRDWVCILEFSATERLTKISRAAIFIAYSTLLAMPTRCRGRCRMVGVTPSRYLVDWQMTGVVEGFG